MEQDKYIFLADGYVEIEGDVNNVSQCIEDILNGKKWNYLQIHYL